MVAPTQNNRVMRRKHRGNSVVQSNLRETCQGWEWERIRTNWIVERFSANTMQIQKIESIEKCKFDVPLICPINWIECLVFPIRIHKNIVLQPSRFQGFTKEMFIFNQVASFSGLRLRLSRFQDLRSWKNFSILSELLYICACIMIFSPNSVLLGFLMLS